MFSNLAYYSETNSESNKCQSFSRNKGKQRRVLKLFNFANAEWIDGQIKQINVPDGKLEFREVNDMNTSVEVKAREKALKETVPVLF